MHLSRFINLFCLFTCFKDISCRIELWLATEYHENGSLYDYLINHTINPRILSQMVYSIANGLWHLHVPIDATNGMNCVFSFFFIENMILFYF